MALLKKQRKERYTQIIELILSHDHKGAYDALREMATRDTGKVFTQEYADTYRADGHKRASSCAVSGEMHDWVKDNNSLTFCRKCCSIVANNPPVEVSDA